MSLKNFFLKNSFTYKIYIYYNLYIRNKAYKNRKSYSQWGEDLFIQEFFKDKAKGFYVDIGSFHPIMYSNTFLLYKNGWNGINVDLNQTSIDLFNIMRPKDYNICAALSDKVEERELFFDHHFSPINTLTKSFYDEANKEIAFKNLKNKKIITKTFSDIINNLSNIPNIDFLNIDCEGDDFSVLKGFNLKNYYPKLICIETHNVNGNESTTFKETNNFLRYLNYSFIKRCGPSSFYSK